MAHKDDDDSDTEDECVILRPAEGFIYRKIPTTPLFLNRFERTRVLEERTKSIDQTGKTFIPEEFIPNFGHATSSELARLELEHGFCPYVVARIVGERNARDKHGKYIKLAVVELIPGGTIQGQKITMENYDKYMSGIIKKYSS